MPTDGEDCCPHRHRGPYRAFVTGRDEALQDGDGAGRHEGPDRLVRALVKSGAAVELSLDQDSSSSARRLRVLFWSSGMLGPIVVETNALAMYRPLEEAGFRRRISSSAEA